jgi:hypothetical protein
MHLPCQAAIIPPDFDQAVENMGKVLIRNFRPLATARFSGDIPHKNWGISPNFAICGDDRPPNFLGVIRDRL